MGGELPSSVPCRAIATSGSSTVLARRGFTFDAALDRFASWSKDGIRIAFSSNRKGSADIYVKQSNGAGSEQLLLESDQNKYANFSPDGRFLLYSTSTPKNQFDVWALPLGGDRKSFVFLNTRFDERVAEFSPDGRWVAYQSDESGRYEIYVRAISWTGGQWQISTLGGSQPVWRADGKELFYLAPDGRLMAAAIAVKESAFEPAVPVTLFQTRLWGGGSNVTNGPQYDVAPDGRFLMDVTTEGSTNSPITLLENWTPPAK
jgi:dipeptidyl aminopeptidase/acylaminoacyl peptidase